MTLGVGSALQHAYLKIRNAQHRLGAESLAIPEERPETRDELHAYMIDVWGIRIPRVSVCPNHCAPFDAFCNAYFAEDDVAVWLASRGFGGKSALLAALGVAEAATLGAGVNIVGGSAEQSRNVHAYMEGTDTNLGDAYWHAPKAPRHLLKTMLTLYRTSLKNGGWVHALAASTRAVRGPHPQRLRLDEVDETNVVILDAALGQPMEARGVKPHVVLSSTHHYPDGTMTEVLSRAAERGWPTFEWCYKENLQSVSEFGWLIDAEVERKKRTVTQVMWDVEYELQEPSYEGRAFDIDAIEAMYSPELGQIKGVEGEVHVFERPVWELDPDWPKIPIWLTELELPEQRQCRTSRRWRMKSLTADQQAGWKLYKDRQKRVKRQMTATYSAGADWGKARDHTIIWILRTDTRPMRWVGYANLRRQPYPIMFGHFNDLVARFDARAAHDATGVGTAAEDYMESVTMDVTMSGQTRVDLFNEYIVAVEDRRLIGPRVEHAHAEHRFCVQDDLWGSGHPPDTVVAGAMAWHAASVPAIIR